MATGCSTNAIIHLIAMARRAGVPLELDDLDRIGRTTPVIANIRPSGTTYLMEDFYYAGGLRALMKQLGDRLDPSAITVTGKPLTDGARRGEDLERGRHPSALEPGLPRGLARGAEGQPRPRGRRHQARGVRPEVPPPQRPGARRRQLPDDEGDHRRPRLPDDARHRARPAQRRPAGRTGHAGMGNDPDAEGAPEARPPRHGAPVRRPHVGHELRRLRAPRRARGLRRRPAGAAPHRRHR